MPWNMIYYDECPETPKVGNIWAAPEWEESNIISHQFHLYTQGQRPPLMVVLPSSSVSSPSGDYFLVDRKWDSDGDDNAEDGWSITIVGDLIDGEQPDITLEPSIHVIDSYHGYIRNGVITDDLEGRSYQ